MAGPSQNNPQIPLLIRNVYRFFFPSLPEFVKKELKDCETVLDLGCGSGEHSPFKYVRPAYSVGVEIHQPSLDECRRRKIHAEYIRADIKDIEFRERSFDAVILLEIIEHFPRDTALQIIKKCSLWAKKKVIIATPNGFLPQDGYNDNPYQVHRSGWTISDLREMGFSVRGFQGWHKLRGYKAIPNIKPVLLGDIISDLTQIVVTHHPQSAFRLFGVKIIDQ